jgi:hypothetical protein
MSGHRRHAVLAEEPFNSRGVTPNCKNCLFRSLGALPARLTFANLPDSQDGQRLCCWSATKTQSAKQLVGQQLWQLQAQPARSSQSTPPHTWRARHRNRMRTRVRRRPPEGRRLPSSAGLAGQPGPWMAWRAGGRSCPTAAERSTQSAQTAWGFGRLELPVG